MKQFNKQAGVMLAFFSYGSIAGAHAFGEPVQLPMPYELYIAGSILALILSFVLLAITGRRPSRKAFKEITLHSPSRLGLVQITLQQLGSVLSLVALVGCVITGLIGSNDSSRNINMTLFWILFVLGGAYLSMLIGDWYRNQNPWHVLFLGRWRGLIKYPTWLGCWPALLQFLVLIQVELFSHTNPKKLAAWLMAFMGVNMLGIVLWGYRRWMQRGEPFAVLFRLFALCSPIRSTGSQTKRLTWRLGLPYARLYATRFKQPGMVLFVFFLLSSTAFDGLRATKVYFGFFWLDPFGIFSRIFGDYPITIYPQIRHWFVLYEFGLLLLSPLLYWFLFAVFVTLGRWLTRSTRSTGELMMAYLPSLVPIAVVYHVTHYYTLLLNQGVKIRGLVSDPLGWGWDIFGTAITGRLPWLPDMASIWASQVILILIGHIAAVWLAHQTALKVEGSATKAVLSQLPMLVLMVVFTAVGLWVLAQPLKG